MSSEFSVIFGAFGCLCSIIVLIICASHSVWYYIRHISDIDRNQKQTMLMESSMIILFLLPTISNVFLRHNYFQPYRTEEQFSPIGCKISMIFTVPPYSVGEIILYSLFMLRIYGTFKDSMFAINKAIPILLISILSLSSVVFSVCIAINVLKSENHTHVEHVGNVLLCYLEYNEHNPAMTMVTYLLPIVIMLIEIFVCVYFIYIFVSRLTTLYGMEVSEYVGDMVKIDTISVIIPESPDVVHSDITETEHETNQAKMQDTVLQVVRSMPKAESIKMKAIMVKQTVLGASALISSVMFYVYGMTMKSADFMGWDIMINVLSIHLMFNYTQFIWDMLCCKVHNKK